MYRVGLRGLRPQTQKLAPKIMSRSPPKSYNGAASGSAGIASVHSL